MPQIAIVTPYLPAPPNSGGRIRIQALVRGLRPHAELDLFTRVFRAELGPDAGSSTAPLGLYHRVHARGGASVAPASVLRSARVHAACPPALRQDLLRAHRERTYHAVVVFHSYALGTALDLPVPVVLDEHNIESAYAAALAPDRRWERLRLARWERMAWRHADLVTTVTASDAGVVRAHRRGPVEVVPNGAATAEIPFVLPSTRASRDVLFVGAMSHPPNVRAALELAREVLPRLRRTHPEATLTLCGRAPAPEVRALAGPGIVVTGTVPSVAPFLARSGACALPLRAGAGSSLKVPEALAAGLPLVASATAVRGFDLADGTHYLHAEDPAACALALARCWDDPERADLRATRGRDLALTLDWDALGARFADLVLATAGLRA